MGTKGAAWVMTAGLLLTAATGCGDDGDASSGTTTTTTTAPTTTVAEETTGSEVVDDVAASNKTQVVLRDAGAALYSLWGNVRGGAPVWEVHDRPDRPALTIGTGADAKVYQPVATEDLAAILVPVYINSLPTTDGWGGALEYYLQDDPVASHVFAVRAPGRDGAFSGDAYDQGVFPAAELDSDWVYTDGFFARYPGQG